jgi:hypothetical protein
MKEQGNLMAHDSEYFRRRAAEVRAASSYKEDGNDAAVAGDLALAFSALARRRSLEPMIDETPLPATD